MSISNNSKSANDYQVGGTHYAAEYQHWDFVAEAGLDYFQGVITKYVARWRKKDGLKDLEKSLHYVVKYSELADLRGFNGCALFDTRPEVRSELITKFCEANQLRNWEAKIVFAVCHQNLAEAEDLLRLALAQVKNNTDW